MVQVVLGLGGASLPPRPLRPAQKLPAAAGREAAADPCGPSAAPRQSHKNCMARVQSNSHLALAAFAADTVDTPSADPPALQPACSDQSNVRGMGAHEHPHSQQQQQGGDAQSQAQPAATVHAAAQQQQQQGASSLVAEDVTGGSTAVSSRGGRKRKPGGAPQENQQASASQGSRPRRSRLAAAAGTDPPASAGSGGRSRSRSTTPAAKRQRQSFSTPSKGQYTDVLHRVVAVPGSVFFVNTPGQLYIGRVNKVESGRRVPSVEVQFRDDNSKYWFPVADVRKWMGEMVRSGTWERYNPGVPPQPQLQQAATAAHGVPEEEDEQAAAEALQSLSTSVTSSRRMAAAHRDGQPAVSSRRRQADSVAAAPASKHARSSSRELRQRVGALMAAVAAREQDD